MKVKFVNTIVFVKNISLSKRFYIELLGLHVLEDYGTIVIFEDHFVIHNSRNLIKTVFKKDRLFSKFKQGSKNLLIYFECDHLEDAFERIKDGNVKFIHEIEKQAWGQNVFRFYDPDNHIVEIGEPFRIQNFV